MRYRVRRLISLSALLACSGSDDPDLASPGEVEVLPLGADASATMVSFVDESTGFMTAEVYDASREIVRFDAARAAMVADATGDAVSGWTASGNDLRWSISGIAFQVRFGTEQGQRRAFFTETATGTICDLRLSGPEQLRISGTRELPPDP